MELFKCERESAKSVLIKEVFSFRIFQNLFIDVVNSVY